MACAGTRFIMERRTYMKVGGTGIAAAEVQQYKGTVNQKEEITADPEAKSFQIQISSAQTELQKLSSDDKMSSEEKAKKRQEIQKQIMELNNMLRERKAELRREKQQKAAEEDSKGENLLPGQEQQEKQERPETVHNVSRYIEKNVSSHRIPVRHMKAMVSADAAIDRAELTESISDELESRVQVLQGEIKQAEANGGYVEAKKSEIEVLENKVAKISGAKMNIISSAISEMKQAVKDAGKKDQKQGTNETAKKQADLPSKDFADRKQQVSTYTKGKMFSNVEFRF